MTLPLGAHYSLTESALSPFQAEPAQRAIARVVNEAPECLRYRNNGWSVEFRNPTSGESIVVTYSGPTIPVSHAQQN